MTPYEMAKAALCRPSDYARRPLPSKWNIDASLGILDWEGMDMTAATEALASPDAAGLAVEKFGMTLFELQDVVAQFSAQVKL